MSDDRPKPSPERERRASRPVEFEDAAANLLSLGTLAGVWYFGNKYTNLEWHWLLGAGGSWRIPFLSVSSASFSQS
jgi:hypothetical protein